MDDKIAIEEHWAVESSLEANARIAGTSAWLQDVFRRLLDVHDQRLSEMDRSGIERSVLSLNAPGIQAIADRKPRSRRHVRPMTVSPRRSDDGPTGFPPSPPCRCRTSRRQPRN